MSVTLTKKKIVLKLMLFTLFNVGLIFDQKL